MNIIFPLLTMILLTFIVSVRLYYFSIQSVLYKKVKLKQLRVYDGEIPKDLNSTRQHYKNMFEMPILFYVLSLLLIITNMYNHIDILCAWCFVIFRILHSLSRIPNRNVYIRFGYFLGSSIALLIGWINFSINIITLTI